MDGTMDGSAAWARPRVTEILFTPYAASPRASGAPQALWTIVAANGRDGLPWHGPVQAARLAAQARHDAMEAERLAWERAVQASSVS